MNKHLRLSFLIAFCQKGSQFLQRTIIDTTELHWIPKRTRTWQAHLRSRPPRLIYNETQEPSHGVIALLCSPCFPITGCRIAMMWKKFSPNVKPRPQTTAFVGPLSNTLAVVRNRTSSNVLREQRRFAQVNVSSAGSIASRCMSMSVPYLSIYTCPSLIYLSTPMWSHSMKKVQS